MINNNTNYNSSFTAGGLLFQEFIALESIITDEHFTTLIDQEGLDNKLLAIKTESSRKRIIPEIKARVEAVSPDFWKVFYTWTEKEQKLGLFYVCLKTYKLIFDIHWEVALKKFKTGDLLDAYSITMFLDELSSKNEKVASWSEKTYDKVNSRYRKALIDAGLMNHSKLNSPNGVPSTFWDYFNNNNEYWFLEACFIK